MTTHSFGGPWTLIKLDLLGRYLKFFNTALQGQPRPASPFDRTYIDAFAGTGQCEIKLTDGTRSTIDGSAKIAAHTDPAFHQIHLVDLKQKHVAELKILAASGSPSEIHVHKDDANSALEVIISKVNWRRTRGVVPPTPKDRKVAFMFKGQFAKDLFNQIGPDVKKDDACNSAADYRERRRGDVDCVYTKDSGYSCYFGLDVPTGKSTYGSIC